MTYKLYGYSVNILFSNITQNIHADFDIPPYISLWGIFIKICVNARLTYYHTILKFRSVAEQQYQILWLLLNLQMVRSIQLSMVPMSKRLLAHRSLSTAAVDALWKQTGSTVTLNLNRPNFLNSLTKDVCVDIRQKVLGWRGSDSDVNCFIMKGNGKAFCAGGDIKALWRALSDADVADIGTYL